MGDAGGPGPGPVADAARAESAGAALSVDAVRLLAQLARSFALLLPVYALGYLGLSFSWVLLALALLAWCRRSRSLKATRLCRALALLEDEERTERLGVRACDLPAWVSTAPEPAYLHHPLSSPPRPPGPAPAPFLPGSGVRARDLLARVRAGPKSGLRSPVGSRARRRCARPAPPRRLPLQVGARPVAAPSAVFPVG